MGEIGAWSRLEVRELLCMVYGVPLELDME